MKVVIKRFIWMILVILIAAGGWLSYERWVRKEPFPDGLIQANGRMEGDHVTVSSKFHGRIAKLLVREGDSVRKGEVLVQLEDPQVKSRVRQARYAVAALQARVKASQTNLEVLKKDVPHSIATAKATVAHAHAVTAECEAKFEQNKRDAKRFRDLAAKGSVDKHRSEQADLALTLATNECITAHTALTQGEEQLAHAKLGWDRIRAGEDNLAALEAQQEQAREVLAEAKSVLEDFTIVAPSQGVVTTRIVDAGEVVSAGMPLLDLVDLDRLYLKAYVPEILIGKLRLGLPARIYTDAYPDRPFEAEVRYISSRAEFTPKEVQTPDERVKLVYAVKLYLIDNPDHCLSPGMPADAVIRWKNQTPWEKPRW
jgi:membrane fusion protein YbhG